MRRFILAASMLAGLAAPAMAQYYDDGPRWGRDRPYGDYYERDRDDRRYERRRRFEEDEDVYDRRPRRGPPPMAGGRCYTSRGMCPVPPGVPVGAPCRCEIPGFGTKRGNVVR